MARDLVLRSRTRLGRRMAIRYLDVLAVAVKTGGWQCVKLYRFPVPLLWIYASGAAEDVGIVVCVRARYGGAWAYHEARRGRAWDLYPCGDVKAAGQAPSDVPLDLRRVGVMSTLITPTRRNSTGT